MKRRLVGVALVLGVAAGLAVACTADESGSADNAAGQALAAKPQSGSGEFGEAAPTEGQGSQGSQDSEGASAETPISQPGVDRALVRTATIALEARDVGETVDSARQIAATEGGYAGDERLDDTEGRLTLQIPADRFDQALRKLSELGEVLSREQTAEDVTEQVVDLDSRVATQRASVNRVRALLAQASTVDEIVQIEEELTSRESELESLLQRRKALGGQVAMSTVTLEVHKATAEPVREDESSGFFSGLVDGWGAFLDFGGGALRVLGAIMPFLLIAVPVAVALLWWRRTRSRAAVEVKQES